MVSSRFRIGLAAATVVAIVVVVALVVTPDPGPADLDTDPYTGRWLVEGIDPRGVEYAGSLLIARDGNGYTLRWIITGSLRQGTGALQGGELTGDWEQIEGIEPSLAGTFAIAIADAELAATIVIDGVAGTGSETGVPAA